MSQERLAALKASAERNRLRLEASTGRQLLDRQTQSLALRTFTNALPKVDPRVADGFKRLGRP